ncbi:MAG: hypothetical protein ABSC50_02580 [Candidatus Bathyarchaeia archaeon]
MSKRSPIAAYSAVVGALDSLQAFDRMRKKATKQIADTCHLPQARTREILKHLAKTGLVASTQTLRRAIWIARYVAGKRTTSYKKPQYLSDAANVQNLAQTDVAAKALLGTTNLSQLDVKNNEFHRGLFNAIVEALTNAGHKGLPTYDFAGGSLYWWLTTTSRAAAKKVIQKLTGQTTLIYDG